MTDRELLQMALDAMAKCVECGMDEEAIHLCVTSSEAIRARLDQCDAGQICLECRVCPDEQPAPEPWKCGCGANLYIDENGKPRSKVQGEKDVPETNFGNMEPVAWRKRINGGYVCCDDMTDFPTCEDHGWEPLYTAPPQREWQGLTAAEQIDFINGAIGLMDVICAVEAKLKEKNNG